MIEMREVTIEAHFFTDVKNELEQKIGELKIPRIYFLERHIKDVQVQLSRENNHHKIDELEKAEY